MSSKTGVGKWQSLRSALAKDAFVRKFGHPFLVCLDWEQATHAGPDETGEFEFRTASVQLDKLGQFMASDLSQALIAPVVKGDRNPFEFISVGRASNCDIVLADSSVSKLHGYLKVLSPSTAEVTDGGSKNGTRVNGVLLEKRTPRRVKSGDTILFGRIPMQFLDPARFYGLL